MNNYIFLVSIPLIFILFYILFYIGKSVRLVDIPNNRKIHKGNVPLVGGIGIFIPCTIILFFFPDDFFIFCFFLCSFFLIIGIIDDYYDINYKIRFCLFLILIIFFVLFENRIETLGFIEYFGYFDLGILSHLFTILCILVLINSINFIDGLDGLASLILFISFSSMFYILLPYLELNSKINFIILILSIFIFLIFNMSLFNLPKIFLGNSGAIFLGFLLSACLITYSQAEDNSFNPSMVPWLVFYPIADLTFIFAYRLLNYKNPFYPDNNHFHHILLKHGYGKRQVLLILSSLHLLMILIGYLIVNFLNNFFSLILFVILLFTYIILLSSIKKIDL